MKIRSKNKPFSVDQLLEYLLKEDNPPAPPTSSQDFAPVEAPQKNISLDQSVDRYFIRYEKESIPTNEVYESISKFKSRSFLFEQLDGLDEEPPADDEEEVPAPDDAPADDAGGGDLGDLGGDLGGDAPTDGGAAPAAGQPVVATPKININDFARSVARLANNFQALIDPKSTILNRAEAYITNNYDQRTAQELMQILEVNYGLAPVSVENTATPGTEFPDSYTAGATGGGEG